MLGGNVSMVISSIWTNIANWSTPTVLFCLLNCMIAIIFIASNFGNKHHGNSPRMSDRVKSVNFSPFYSTMLSEQVNLAGELTGSGQVSITKELTRALSFLDRVRSFKLTSSFIPYSSPDDTFIRQDEHFDVPPDSNVVEDHNEASDNSCYNVLSNVSGKSSGQVNITKELTRAPLFLDRVRSFKLASPFKPNSPPDDTFTRQDEHFDVPSDHDVVEDHNDANDNSRYNDLYNVSGKVPSTNLAKRSTSHLTKSSSEKRVVESYNDDDKEVERRVTATMRESVGTKDVNVKADDFIKRFKQQLKLQRIDSLQRVRDMLNRGT